MTGPTSPAAWCAYASSKWAIRRRSSAGAVVNTLSTAACARSTRWWLARCSPQWFREDDPGAYERLSATPLGRAGLPSDVAELVLFLLSDRSAFITGAELAIDGGQTTGTVLTYGVS